jgi:penicillin amidase
VQGRLRSFDWRERVPIERLPSARLDTQSRPWVMAMDQPWPNPGGLGQIEWLWRPGDRAARLETALDEATREGPIDLREAAALLRDDRALRAPRVVTAIVGLARRGGRLPVEAEEIAQLLERWDGRMSAGSAGAAAYHLVIEHLLEALLREPFGDPLFHRYLEAPHVRPQYAVERLVLRAAKLRRSGGWTDEAQVTRAARAGLRAAWVGLNYRLGPTRERWSWGGLHQIRFRPIAEVGLRSSRLDRPFAAAGSGQTLRFTRHRPGISFEVEQAALYRIAMDLGSPDRLLSALAPGQSEHPGHPHYADGLARLRAPRLALFRTSRLAVEEENAERLLLEPAP